VCGVRVGGFEFGLWDFRLSRRPVWTWKCQLSAWSWGSKVVGHYVPNYDTRSTFQKTATFVFSLIEDELSAVWLMAGLLCIFKWKGHGRSRSWIVLIFSQRFLEGHQSAQPVSEPRLESGTYRQKAGVLSATSRWSLQLTITLPVKSLRWMWSA
jgi:hypothetical protein